MGHQQLLQPQIYVRQRSKEKRSGSCQISSPQFPIPLASHGILFSNHFNRNIEHLGQTDLHSQTVIQLYVACCYTWVQLATKGLTASCLLPSAVQSALCVQHLLPPNGRTKSTVAIWLNATMIICSHPHPHRTGYQGIPPWSCMCVRIYKASGFVALAHTALARTHRAAAPLQLCIMHAGDHRHSPGVGVHKQQLVTDTRHSQPYMQLLYMCECICSWLYLLQEYSMVIQVCCLQPVLCRQAEDMSTCPQKRTFKDSQLSCAELPHSEHIVYGTIRVLIAAFDTQ